VNQDRGNRTHWRAAILLLAAATLWAFWAALDCGFVNYDDPVYVTNNIHVRNGLTWAGIRWAFTTTDAVNWHPLTWLSHMVDCQVYGLKAMGHHLTSVLLHAANAILLLLLLRRMTGALWRSALVAALFALHPLRVESVVWISERKDVLSAFFGMLTLWAYVRYIEDDKAQSRRGKIFYLAALACFALGLMAKPMVMTLPFVLLLLDYWPLRRNQAVAVLLTEKTPFLVLSVISCVVTVWVQHRGGAVASFGQYPIGERLANIPLAYAGYLSKDFWPADLVSFYPHHPLRAGAVLGALLLLGLITGGAIWRRRSQPYLAVGWFWFLGMLAPTVGVVQVGAQLMADRYSYLPSIGLWIMMIWGLADMAAAQPLFRQPLVFVSAVAVMSCAFLTSRHARIYRDSETLWQATLRIHPENLMARDNLSKWLVDQGRLREAREQCRQTLAIRGDDPEAEWNLARIDLREGKADEAAADCLKSIAAQPRSAQTYETLGEAHLKKGRMDLAIETFQQALNLQPDFPEAWCNLGFALAQERRLPEAMNADEKALALAPTFALAHNDLGGILRRMGRAKEAMEHFQRAAELEPDFGEAHYNIADILLEQGQTNAALAEYQKALARLPNLGPAKARIAEILRRQRGHNGP
jgi:tetratricopeptide (TPR) repeat protein